jgi:prepilin-type N-terminal cleavage/methylation domain-containing protein
MTLDRETQSAAEQRRSSSAGFTLIELMIVVLVIGVLASIMISRVDAFRQRAHYVSIGQDFRNLGAAQERYFQLNREYAVNLGDLDFSTSPGVEIDVTEASIDGWAAVGTHQALAGTYGCGIYMGAAAAPALPNGTPVSVGPGVPECTR